MDICTLTKESENGHPAMIGGTGDIHQIWPVRKKMGGGGRERNPRIKELELTRR